MDLINFKFRDHDTQNTQDDATSEWRKKTQRCTKHLLYHVDLRLYKCSLHSFRIIISEFLSCSTRWRNTFDSSFHSNKAQWSESKRVCWISQSNQHQKNLSTSHKKINTSTRWLFPPVPQKMVNVHHLPSDFLKNTNTVTDMRNCPLGN